MRTSKLKQAEKALSRVLKTMEDTPVPNLYKLASNILKTDGKKFWSDQYEDLGTEAFLYFVESVQEQANNQFFEHWSQVTDAIKDKLANKATFAEYALDELETGIRKKFKNIDKMIGEI